jgi:hypothetical protein
MTAAPHAVLALDVVGYSRLREDQIGAGRPHAAS